MAEVDTAIDHETIYRLLYEERWSDLLDFVRRNRDAVGDDALLSHAVDVFVDTFLEHLPEAESASSKCVLETLFLLHTGRTYRLAAPRFEAVVERLVRLHGERPRVALGYARYCPQNAECAAVLERHDLREEARHAQAHRIRLEATRVRDEVDHTTSLFRSRQEEEFFMAVREVFASYFVYPNVALSSVLDFESLRSELSPAERQFFFRGIVDCVVFDQQNAYRPRYFFELDSPYHDTDRQAENDARKDRILAAAGQTLLRVRVKERQAGREAFAPLLREIVQR